MSEDTSSGNFLLPVNILGSGVGFAFIQHADKIEMGHFYPDPFNLTGFEFLSDAKKLYMLFTRFYGVLAGIVPCFGHRGVIMKECTIL
jgi:hypothetical protein